jgi:hypothetical protein
MKKFKDLKIGDKIYLVIKGYSKNILPELREIKIHSLSDDNDNIIVNSNYSLPKNDSIYNGDYEYFCCNKEDVKELYRQMGLDLINEYEEKIKNLEEQIKQVRITYYDYMNNIK